MGYWNPVSTLETLAENGGIIVLWYNADLMNQNPWRTTGVYGLDTFYYFFLPAGFTHTGEDEFTYNFGLEYVKSSVAVTGYVEHNGIRQLQEGKTEPFWHLQESAPAKVTLQTDETNKLPYVEVPSRGLPSFATERRYFIPVPEVA